MNKKFYQTKKFLKIKNIWYAKLKKSGFKDIEHHDFKTGLGQGSPYLSSEHSVNEKYLRNDALPLSRAYQNYRNFLEFAPFYPNLVKNFKKYPYISNNFKTLYNYLNFYRSATDSPGSPDLISLHKTEQALKTLKIIKPSTAPSAPSAPTLPTGQAGQAGQAGQDRTRTSTKPILFYKEHLYTKASFILWSMYCDGATYREISKQLRKLHKAKKLKQNTKRNTSAPYSLYWVKTTVHELIIESRLFNRYHPEGLFNDLEDLEDGIEHNTPVKDL